MTSEPNLILRSGSGALGYSAGMGLLIAHQVGPRPVSFEEAYAAQCGSTADGAGVGAAFLLLLLEREGHRGGGGEEGRNKVHTAVTKAVY